MGYYDWYPKSNRPRSEGVGVGSKGGGGTARARSFMRVPSLVRSPCPGACVDMMRVHDLDTEHVILIYNGAIMGVDAYLIIWPCPGL